MKIRKLSNEGVALPTVIMVMLVIVTLAGVVLTLITSQTNTEVIYEDNITALHAAEAGLNLYLWDLNDGDALIKTPTDETDIEYPVDNPVAAFKLKEVTEESTENKKVILATGWMLADTEIKRTIKAIFAKKSYTEFVYCSNNDPDNIWWTHSDNCYGPYHTNTNLCVYNHPTFWKDVTYCGIIKPYNNLYSDKPVIKTSARHTDKKVEFKTDTNELVYYAKDNDLYFKGRTSIRLNSNGTVDIWNPEGESVKRNITIPPEGAVIYVDELSDADYNDKFNEYNGNAFISGVLNGRLTVVAKHDIYITGYDPTVNEWNTAKYSKTNGVIYNDTGFILDTTNGDVTVTGKQDDMLGLIAEQNIAVLTKGWFDDKKDAISAIKNMYVYSAIFAIKGSFANSYQLNNSPGTSLPNPKGILTVRGAIIQNVRGNVGLAIGGEVASGYVKDYAHDSRMLYDQPPHFLEPTSHGWEIKEWVESD